MAQEVLQLCETPAAAPNSLKFAYELEQLITEKITQLVQRVYRGAGVDFTPTAVREIEKLTKLGFGDLPVCMAKTQYSFSDNPQLLGVPKDFCLQVQNVKVNAGAGFIVVYTGTILTMP